MSPLTATKTFRWLLLAQRMKPTAQPCFQASRKQAPLWTEVPTRPDAQPKGPRAPPNLPLHFAHAVPASGRALPCAHSAFKSCPSPASPQPPHMASVTKKPHSTSPAFIPLKGLHYFLLYIRITHNFISLSFLQALSSFYFPPQPLPSSGCINIERS